MLKKIIQYTDYFGNPRNEAFYFNYSQAELLEKDASIEGGLENYLNSIGEKSKSKEIMEFWKNFILDSYGEKSSDGRRFIKSKELSVAFSQTEAFNNLFIELCSDLDKAAEFVKGVFPKPISSEKDPEQSASLLSSETQNVVSFANKEKSLLEDE